MSAETQKMTEYQFKRYFAHLENFEIVSTESVSNICISCGEITSNINNCEDCENE